MLHAVGWSLVLALLALWSLAAWALHALVGWTAANAGGVAVGAAAVQAPAWLAPWIPAEFAALVTSLQSVLGPLVDGVLSTAPALAGIASVAIWVVWAVGALLIVVLGLIGRRLLGGARPIATALASAAAGNGSDRWTR